MSIPVSTPQGVTNDTIGQANDRDAARGSVLRLSEASPAPFQLFSDRFVRYWPRKTFHLKYSYETGFVEKKIKGTARNGTVVL